MPTIRSPRGLALTLLGTLALVVLATGTYSLPDTLRGWHGDEHAMWLRSPQLVALTAAGGVGLWVVLSLVSYAVRLRWWLVAAAFSLASWGGAATYLSATDYGWPSETLEPASLLGQPPDGVLGTSWRGLTSGGCSWTDITELSIGIDGAVQERRWSGLAPVLFPVIHALGITPNADPEFVTTGKLVDDVIYWADSHRSPQRVSRSGRRLVREYVPRAEVTVGPLPTSG